MKERQTYLIINADDLGAHPTIDRGILELAREGIVTSSSLLVTTPNWRTTLEEARRVKGLGLGLHLDITMGKSLCAPSDVPELVSQDGSFRLSLGQLIRRAELGPNRREFLKQVSREFAAQFSAARSTGATFTHFDGHQHVHMIPAFFRLASAAARQNGITKCRFVSEWAKTYLNARHVKTFMTTNGFVRWAYMGINRMRIQNELSSPRCFYGFLMSGYWNEKLLIDCLRAIPKGSSAEFGVHPGYPAETKDVVYRLKLSIDWLSSPNRRIELDSLSSPGFRTELEKRSIKLSSYDCV